MLVHVVTLGGAELCEQVISRVKVMSELDIAERRVPQDGRFRLALKGRPIDFRVSVMPSVHGEDAVLRILDKQALTDELQGLRLDHIDGLADPAEYFERLADAGVVVRTRRRSGDRRKSECWSTPAATSVAWAPSGSTSIRRAASVRRIRPTSSGACSTRKPGETCRRGVALATTRKCGPSGTSGRRAGRETGRGPG